MDFKIILDLSEFFENKIFSDSQLKNELYKL